MSDTGKQILDNIGKMLKEANDQEKKTLLAYSEGMLTGIYIGRGAIEPTEPQAKTA